MNSAPSKMKRAATETSEEIRNSAECTAFRAMTVSSPARMAAIENIQKKTDSQPDKIMIFGLCALVFVVWRVSRFTSQLVLHDKDQSPKIKDQILSFRT